MFGKFPGLFGEDTPEQRQRWMQELLWAITIVDTRAYGARFHGPSPPLCATWAHVRTHASADGHIT